MAERRREQLRYNGESLLLIAILYSVSRFFIEFFRSQVIITPAQYASVLIAVLCFALCAVVGRKNRKILINKGGVD
ncbi:MAG: prolipoprotein diacylglyceryl transferase [Firmicutes bacterium]|nr:prolipoprotein diacylglyceryl transferase [Bacillota bacterium]